MKSITEVELGRAVRSAKGNIIKVGVIKPFPSKRESVNDGGGRHRRLGNTSIPNFSHSEEFSNIITVINNEIK